MSVSIESGFSSEEVLNIRFPLHRACRDGDIGALCSLLQCITSQADLAAEDSFYGWTPIHWAAHFGKLECMVRLVQVGCGVNAVTSKFAQTPTHIAAFGGHPECLLWLLQAGADINRQDYVGETPIHKAARAGSMDCVRALLLQGAKADLRNASGLTAADLAHAQGFQECAQLLSNAQNQLNQLNGFSPHGAVNGGRTHVPAPSFFNGAPSRKRSLDCMESNHIKKARTDGLDSALSIFGGTEGELESMHMEPAPAPSGSVDLSMPTSGGRGRARGSSNSHDSNLEIFHAADAPSGDPIATGFTNGHAPEKLLPGSGFFTSQGSRTPLTNGSTANLANGFPVQWDSTAPGSAQNGFPCRSSQTEDGDGRQSAEMCGALHLEDSPGSCVSQRPSWAASSDEALHYGHYHGFGDTAEIIDEASSQMEHCTSVKVEERYDHTVFSTLQLYHGS